MGDETVAISPRIYVLPERWVLLACLDDARESPRISRGQSLEEPLPGDAAKQLDGFFDQLKNTDLVEAAHASSEASSKGGNGYPLPSFVPPEMVWEEQLRPSVGYEVKNAVLIVGHASFVSRPPSTQWDGSS